MDTSFLLFLRFLKRESGVIFACLVLVKSKPPEALTQCVYETRACAERQQKTGALSQPWSVAYFCWRGGVLAPGGTAL